MKLSRKQLKEALNTVPMVQILGGSPELTHKQKEFARLVASGETGAGAYRKAYNSKGKPKTQGDHASRLKNDDRIAAEIEAYKAANAALAYQTPQQLRQLVIHSLVKVITNPEAKEATVVQAAKVLGTVTEVAAFTERKEITTVKTSADARAALMAKLREVSNNTAEDATIKESADSLTAELELSSSDGNVTSDSSGNVTSSANDDDGNITSDNATHDAQEASPPVSESAAPTSDDPTAPIEVWSPSIPIHTIPHTRSDSKSNDPHPPSDLADSLEAELSGNTPPSKTK